jgi:myo-inositol-1(or 4)-monophosphatase
MSNQTVGIIKAAKAGGKIIKKLFGEHLKVDVKDSLNDFRTKADTEAEAAILGILRKEFPEYGIYSEEIGNLSGKSEYDFVIDPLDGSYNFVIGIPDFSVSIALRKNKEIIAAVVYHPILNYTYCAEKGKGVFLNGKKISVNRENNIRKSTVIYASDYKFSKSLANRVEGDIWRAGVNRMINNWSPAASICLLAAGKIEAVIFSKIHLYDFCAGKLIAKEAGATVTDFKGMEEKNDANNQFIASNGLIHRKLLNIFKEK